MLTAAETREHQQHLRACGWPITVDGAYGSQTTEATANFQAGWAWGYMHGATPLPVDGQADEATRAALEQAATNGGRCSEHFAYREFRSNGNGWIKVSWLLLLMLEKVRALSGLPLVLISAYRDPAYNRLIGGAANSRHTFGDAVDISRAVGLLWWQAVDIGFTGIGIIDDGTGRVAHVDTRAGLFGAPTFWYYDPVTHRFYSQRRRPLPPRPATPAPAPPPTGGDYPKPLISDRVRDVSNWDRQGLPDPDWEAWSRSGDAAGTWIRAGGGSPNGPHGGWWDDQFFRSTYAACQRIRMPSGPYWFFDPRYRKLTDELDRFERLVGDRVGELPALADIETFPANWSRQQMTDYVLDCLLGCEDRFGHAMPYLPWYKLRDRMTKDPDLYRFTLMTPWYGGGYPTDGDGFIASPWPEWPIRVHQYSSTVALPGWARRNAGDISRVRDGTKLIVRGGW